MFIHGIFFLDLNINNLVHYTNSTVLELLPYTEYSLHSVEKLLLNYKVAPMSGQINCGGGYGASLNDMTTAFADITKTEHWNGKYLLQRYGNLKYKTRFYTSEQLYNKLIECANDYFVELMPLLVNLLRDYQMSTLPCLTDDEILIVKEKFTQTLHAITKIYITQFIVAKYLSLHNKPKDIFDLVPMNLYFTKVPCDFFESDCKTQDKIVEEIFSDKFLVDKNKNQILTLCKELEIEDTVPYELNTTLLYPKRMDFINSALYGSKFVITENALNNIENTVRCSIQTLTKKVDFLFDILKRTFKTPLLCENIKLQIENQFPIVFFVENDLNKFEKPKYEHRSIKSLVLGEDIKFIGIEEKHLSYMVEFLQKHNLMDKMKIVDIYYSDNKTKILSYRD